MSDIDDMSRVNFCMQKKIDMNSFNTTFINMINANRFFFYWKNLSGLGCYLSYEEKLVRYNCEIWWSNKRGKNLRQQRKIIST